MEEKRTPIRTKPKRDIKPAKPVRNTNVPHQGSNPSEGNGLGQPNAHVENDVKKQNTATKPMRKVRETSDLHSC